MKKSSLFLCFLLTGSMLLLNSCKDIIAKDITGDTPTVILPQSNDTVAVNPVHFKWNELEGATKYRLEIVSPSFTNISIYALDSIVTGTNFFFPLDSNEYQFRMTAINAGYESQVTAPITFWVGTSAGSSTGGVLLNTPLDNSYVNETFNGYFSWLSLAGANTYTFELHQGTTFAGATQHYADQLGSVSIYSSTGAQLTEGPYTWGVKAFLSNGNETAYTKRTFYVDTTNPGTAIPVSPVSGQSISLAGSPSVTFTWSFPPDNGTVNAPVFATWELATTSTFATIVLSHPYAAAQTTATENFSTQSVPSGTYYWRLRLSDAAGNTAAFASTARTIVVNP